MMPRRFACVVLTSGLLSTLGACPATPVAGCHLTVDSLGPLQADGTIVAQGSFAGGTPILSLVGPSTTYDVRPATSSGTSARTFDVIAAGVKPGVYTTQWKAACDDGGDGTTQGPFVEITIP